MAYIQTYKGLRIVMPEPLTGTGGTALNFNFKAIANHMVDTTAVHGSTAANTINTIVQRGAAGEFASGTLTVTGNVIPSGYVNATGDVTGYDLYANNDITALGTITGARLVITYGGGLGTVAQDGSGLVGLTSGTALITSANSGTFSHGFAKRNAGASVPTINASGIGAFSGGYVYNDTSGALNTHVITASGIGSFAHGRVNAYGDTTSSLVASGSGCAAFGNADSVYGGLATSSQIVAGAQAGAFAVGNAISTVGKAKIGATHKGSFANGYVKSDTAYYSYITSINFGSHASGYVTSGGTGDSKISATEKGSFAHGGVEGGLSQGTILSSNIGSTAFGYVYGRGTASEITSSAKGSLSSGYVLGGYLTASGAGSVAFGAVYNDAGYESTIAASSSGSFAHGYVKGTSPYQCSILSSARGSHASGYVYTKNATGSIEANGYGAFAHGHVNSYSAYPAYIKATAKGSVALGVSSATTGYTAYITSSGIGSLAIGYSRGYAALSEITASAAGACAFGYANSASIAAIQPNSFQFGMGVNNTANSLQVGVAGTGIRLQTDGTIVTGAGTSLAAFSGAITNLTVVNGIVTAAS